MRASISLTPTISCRLTSSALRCSALCAPYLFCGTRHAAQGQQWSLRECLQPSTHRLTIKICALTAVSMEAEVRSTHLLG